MVIDINPRKVSIETILNISYDLLCREGLNSLTVKKIASKGKFSTYPTYYNFATLSDLQKKTVDLLISNLKEQVPVMIDQNIHYISEAVYDFIKNKPGLIKSFFADHKFYMYFNNKILALFADDGIEPIELQINLAVIFSSVMLLHQCPTTKTTHILRQVRKISVA